MRTPIIERTVAEVGNEQRIFRFDNGYGASVVRGPYTYGGDQGLFELAVLEFEAPEKWHLTYETPITEDVIGRLSEPEVQATLEQIAALPSKAGQAS